MSVEHNQNTRPTIRVIGTTMSASDGIFGGHYDVRLLMPNEYGGDLLSTFHWTAPGCYHKQACGNTWSAQEGAKAACMAYVNSLCSDDGIQFEGTREYNLPHLDISQGLREYKELDRRDALLETEWQCDGVPEVTIDELWSCVAKLSQELEWFAAFPHNVSRDDPTVQRVLDQCKKKLEKK